MKIAQVCPYDFSRPGGVRSHIVSLSKYLSKLGHEVKILAPAINTDLVDIPNVHFFGKNRSLNLAGTKIDVNMVLGREKKALSDFLIHENFDVIHYHTVWNPFLPFQVLKRSKARNIATFHDTPKNKLVGRWLMPAAAKLIFRYLNEVISVSQTQSNYISRFSRKKIHIIPNGIDLEKINTYASNKRSDDFIQLLFLGRLEPRKGVFEALEVFRILKSTFPKTRLIIVGDGDQREELEKKIQTYELKNVKLLGFIEEKRKFELLKESDIYLAPALYGESFGIVLLEAMAAGTAIAGYANEGYKNVLSNDLLDAFTEPGQTHLLAEMAKKLVSKSAREKHTDEGLKQVKKYDWQHLVRKVEEIYL